MKLLMVNVGVGRYAVPADRVSRIIDPAIEPDFLLEESRAVLRGESFPLIDLHAAAGEIAARTPVYLLLQGRQRQVVVPVDDAEAIRDVPPGDIAPLPLYIFAQPHRAFRGVFEDATGPRLLLDEDGLL